MAETVAVQLALLAGGVLALYAGAELLVAGAARIALGVGLRAVTVGVTVVALATTAPELFVAVVGAFDVSTDIGLGAVVGSNVANVGLVLGLAALIRPLPVGPVVLRRHVPFMLLSAVLLLVLGADGTLSRLDGLVFLAILGGFTALLLYYANADPPTTVDRPDEGVDLRDVAFVVVGLIALVVGSRWLISGGRGILSAMGFSDLFIGLTVLAIGTSLPELAASVVGAIRGETAFSIGNVVGSNIYNVLAVLGIVAVIVPIPVEPAVVRFEIPVMIGFSVLMVALMYHGRRLSRIDGAILVVCYVGFVYLLLP